METSQSERSQIILMPQKSMGVTILLTILFGPLGMFYSTIIGGIVMLILSILIGIVTLGFGILVTWPICIIWAAVATNNHNNKLLRNNG